MVHKYERERECTGNFLGLMGHGSSDQQVI